MVSILPASSGQNASLSENWWMAYMEVTLSLPFSMAQTILKVHSFACWQCKRMIKEQRKLPFHGLALLQSPGAGSLDDGACSCRAVVAWEVTWCGLPEALAYAWGCLMLWQMLHDCSAQEFDLA